MQPNYSSIGQVFSAQTRYTVPLFQRPYVWTKEEQWQPLWEDVRALTERVLDPPSHKQVAGHFLGTVVLEQLKTPAIAMPQRQVIDGQQRLTTLQLLLKAAEHALAVTAPEVSPESRGSVELAAGQLSQLSRNQFAAAAEEQYKVWPTNEDRGPFMAVMDCAAESGVDAGDGRMAQAYRFFRLEIAQWLAARGGGKAALALASALKDHLRIIVLDLDDTDEPQAIFEDPERAWHPPASGRPHEELALVEAGRQKADQASLYDRYWSLFDRDHDYWRQVVGTGHAARPRVDTYLQNWLTVATREAIAVKHLYDRFLAYASDRRSRLEAQTLDIEALMTEIHAGAGRYREIDRPTGSSTASRALRRLARLDFVVFRPVLIALTGRPGIDEGDLERSIQALESFLLRRMICGLQTRGYNALMLDLLRTLASVADESPAAPALITVLDAGSGSAMEWPNDDLFRHNWLTRRFYGWFRRDRVLMILQAIEEHYQALATKSEPILSYDFSKLTIEHVMPQSWAAHWPLGQGRDVASREAAIQNIGNLTLVSGKLNPSLSNSPWVADGEAPCKRTGLELHSKLELNRRLLSGCGEEWDEGAIAHRAQTLFEAAREIWPSAASLKG